MSLSSSSSASSDVLHIEDVNALPSLQCIEVPLLSKSNNPEVLFNAMGGRDKVIKALSEGKPEDINLKFCAQGNIFLYRYRISIFSKHESSLLYNSFFYLQQILYAVVLKVKSFRQV